MSPMYIKCPAAYIKLLSATDNPVVLKWREGVLKRGEALATLVAGAEEDIIVFDEFLEFEDSKWERIFEVIDAKRNLYKDPITDEIYVIDRDVRVEVAHHLIPKGDTKLLEKIAKETPHTDLKGKLYYILGKHTARYRLLLTVILNKREAAVVRLNTLQSVLDYFPEKTKKDKDLIKKATEGDVFLHRYLQTGLRKIYLTG